MFVLPPVIPHLLFLDSLLPLAFWKGEVTCISSSTTVFIFILRNVSVQVLLGGSKCKQSFGGRGWRCDTAAGLGCFVDEYSQWGRNPGSQPICSATSNPPASFTSLQDMFGVQLLSVSFLLQFKKTPENICRVVVVGHSRRH